MGHFFVYLLANKRPTLYVGMTDNIFRRMNEHKTGIHDGFTKRYKIHSLVYYEIYPRVEQALAREQELKSKSRKYKFDLIKKFNPYWKDLSFSIPFWE